MSFAFLGLSGCSILRPHPSLRVPLATLQLSNMQVTMPKGNTLAPGKKSPLVVSFTDATGKTLSTAGQGHGTIPWSALNVSATVVQINQSGVVKMPETPSQSDGNTGVVTIAVPGKPDLTAQVQVFPRYDIAYRAHYSGADGLSGNDGVNGIDGTDGMNGSMDPNNPTAGSNGTDGTDGTPGGNGSDGNDGPPVLIRVAKWPGSRPLLEVSVQPSMGLEKWFLLDPNGGSITVTSDGGSGGSAGRGGRGGKGGSGGIGGFGQPNGLSGRDGLNGTDGMRGSDGAPGQITMIYDPAVAPYIHAMHLSSFFHPPVLLEQPVKPLW